MFSLEIKTIEGDDVPFFSMLGIDGEEISGSRVEICRQNFTWAHGERNRVRSP